MKQARLGGGGNKNFLMAGAASAGVVKHFPTVHFPTDLVLQLLPLSFGFSALHSITAFLYQSAHRLSVGP
jgi:hypothetical protein